MHVKIRAILFSVALALVAVIGPLLVFYAQGYRYNFEKKRVEQTGVLFIKSYPRSASITLNERLNKKTTPTEIANLLPAVYRISISKKGYTSWQKQLTIIPRMTTFIEDVVLFKSEPQTEMIIGGQIQNSLCSLISRQLAVIIDRQLIVIDVERGKITSQTPVSNKTFIVAWSKNGLNLLLNDNDAFYIYSPASQIKKIVAYNKKPLQRVIWENNSDTNVLGVFKNQLYKYNFSNKKIEALNLPDAWQAIQPMNDYFIGLRQIGQQTFLSQIKGKDVVNVMSVPNDDNYQIDILNDKLLFLLNRNLGIGYLLDPTDANNPLQTYITAFNDYSWLNNSLLYWNDHEINVYQKNENNKQTLERTSAEIKNVAWHNGLANVFAIINNQLKIYELDNRDKRNVWDYQSLGKITPDQATICFSQNGKKLLTSFNNDKKGVYQLTIQ
jgi:hypothetical protein